MHRINSESVHFNYTELCARIESKYGYEEFAKLMSMRKTRLKALLNGKCEFTQPEIIRAAALLNINPIYISDIFFTH